MLQRTLEWFEAGLDSDDSLTFGLTLTLSLVVGVGGATAVIVAAVAAFEWHLLAGVALVGGVAWALVRTINARRREVE